MATVFPFVFAPEDEKNFLSFLAQFELRAYPERVPHGWKPFVVKPENQHLLVEDAYYFADERGAPVEVRPVKRGKEKGTLEIDEVNSPVMHYLRSVVDEAGQLRSGRLWCELNLTGDMQKNPAFDERFRRMMLAIREHLKTRTFRSQPDGWHIGHAAARLSKTGTVLREEGRKGVELKAWK
jgi:hypothetical protein